MAVLIQRGEASLCARQEGGLKSFLAFWPSMKVRAKKFFFFLGVKIFAHNGGRGEEKGEARPFPKHCRLTATFLQHK